MATTVTIKPVSSAAENYKDILGKAEILLEKVLADEKFAYQIKEAHYSGGTLFKESSGRVVSKQKNEIVDIVLKGIERDTDPDNVLDMQVRPYPHKRGVVGSATLGRQPIKPAIWFLERCKTRSDAISLARHLMHEWLHVAGFFHGGSGSGQDDVPYQVGDIVRNIAKSYRGQKGIDEGELEGFLDEDEFTAHLMDQAELDIEYDETEW